MYILLNIGLGASGLHNMTMSISVCRYGKQSSSSWVVLWLEFDSASAKYREKVWLYNKKKSNSFTVKSQLENQASQGRFELIGHPREEKEIVQTALLAVR